MSSAEDTFGYDPGNTDNLIPELQPVVEKTDFGKCLRSPLVYQIPFFSWKMANIQYAAKSKRLKELLAARQYDRAIWMYEKPYRIPVLHGWLSQFPDVVKSLLLNVWMDAEFPHQYKKVALDLFRATGFLTDAPEKWNELVSPLIVYRGTTHFEGKYGISWTLDKEKALWFSRRFSGKRKQSYLWKATISKTRVLAYIRDRGEEEIVIKPSIIQQVQESQYA